MMNRFRILKGMIEDIKEEMRRSADGDYDAMCLVIDRMRQIKDYAAGIEEDVISARFVIDQQRKAVQHHKKAQHYDVDSLPPD